ncbi:octopamine receptor beta-2R-like [Porites lutea]|uniref:octopamine receptor beta-2R-like n=1 Tax=Porites lutea TaxID=51062 RepID=UPI003CC5F4EC
MDNVTRNYGRDLAKEKDNVSLEMEQTGRALHQTETGQAVIVFLTLQSVLIICANSLVFVLFISTRYLRTRTNYCLVSLAAGDCLAGLVSLPLVLACSTTLVGETCTSMDLCQRFLSISTILHLLVATSERYFKIKRPFKYNMVVTKRRVLLLLLGVWLFSCGASFIQLAWITGPREEKIRRFDIAYAIFCLVALAFVPFSIIACIDGHIFYYIHKEKKMRQALTESKPLQKQQKRRKNDRKAAIIYVIMTVTFVLGWFPYFIFTLLWDLEYINRIPFALTIIFVVLKFSTALINPLLYTFFKNDFRKALQSLIEREQCLDGSNEVITTTLV